MENRCIRYKMMEFNVPSEENPTRIEQRKTTTKKKKHA
jgi:hypothetical protein